MKRIKVLPVQLLARKLYLLPLIISFILFLAFCSNSNSSDTNHTEKDSIAIRRNLGNSPVVPAQESMKLMTLEKGFEVKLIAAEPLVNSPVAMIFDEKNRAWVAEMENYMPDIDGTGEDKPTGKIVILEDKNNDGVFDDRKIVLDSLVLPRAICLIEDGLLVAEPPNLWYFRMRDDKPVSKILVDNKYTEGGNVEHQPNGLVRAMDNWIYNAEGKKRYKKKGDKWIIDRMIQRGQWGIAQDDYGRLFYNNNSQNLLGDYFLPVFGNGNSRQRRVSGFNENIVPDNELFPVRPTPGVNRGYMKGILDDSLRLESFTAASGPTIYRGDLFPKEYRLNAFVPEPSANLIKRDILVQNGYRVQGKQAYKGKEFLASSDERFRPVIAYNGPDGALYVVDLYRGVIQHKTYLTDYLKKEIKSRELEKPLSCGRIYKIVPEHTTPAAVKFSNNPADWVKLLGHPNGWVRDKAQQLLVDRKAAETVTALKTLAKDQAQPVPAMHALWTLEGMGKLTAEDVMAVLKGSFGNSSGQDWALKMHSLSLLPSVMNATNYKQFLPYLNEAISKKDSIAAPYVAFLTRNIRDYDQAAASRLTMSVVKQFPQNNFVADAIINGLEGKELAFQKEFTALNPDTTLALHKRLTRFSADIRNSGSARKTAELAKSFPKGVALFKTVCQTCHGEDGNGVKSLAPPLNYSNWVTGDKNKLIPIVLFGLTGPVKVQGITYGPPEINGDMPGVGNNKEFTDEDLAQVMSYIRGAWSNSADKVTAAEVKAIRGKYKGRQKAFTADELNKIK